MKGINKLMKKLEHQAKVNPGNKVAYEQPARPRSSVFKSKKNYNRQTARKETARAICAW